MGSLTKICFIVLISGLLSAQSPVSSGGGDSSPREGDMKKLLEAIAAQQQEANDQKNALAEQQKQIAEQQRQLAEQRQEIDSLKQQLGQHQTAPPQDAQPPHVVNAALNTDAGDSTAASPSGGMAAQKSPESPLSIRIGGAQFTPGGFMDLTFFWRSTNVGSGYGTNFFAIPFNNTIPGQITETRFTAENSRITLKVTDTFKGTDVMGYVETDFHGFVPVNANVTSNSNTLRLRQYWANVKRGKWELLAGQAWGWLTPNRVGMGALPSDVFYSLDMDANYQLGLTWTRAATVRGIFHPNEHWGIGLGIENPDQFVGQANQVTFPAFFNVPAVTTQFDAANQTTTPNLSPDVIAKVAYDKDIHGKHYHVEGVGLMSSIRVLPVLNGTSNSKYAAGASFAFNLELFKNFRLLANGFWSDGGGRYIYGSGPDVVLRPNGILSLVHAGAGIGGIEWQVTDLSLFALYYGVDYFQRNFYLDTSPGAKPNTFIGYGGPGSSNFANRALQEPTIDWIITLWRDPQHGALQLNNQVSYLTRAPWVVLPGQPKNARSTMVWCDIRYVLP